MTKWAEQPIIRLNNFIQSKLRSNGIIPDNSLYVSNTEDQGEISLPFIMPAQQQIELMTPYDSTAKLYGSLPFCVYTNSDRSSMNEPYMECSQSTYIFYSNNVDTLFEIKSYTKDLCKRQDYAAADINYFYRHDTTYPFDFKSIQLVTGVGPNPTGDEGGRYSYMLVLSYDCTYEGVGRSDDDVPNSGNIGMYN